MRAPTCAVALLAFISSAVIAQGNAPPKQTPAGCDTPQSHQWDFWVGKWEVHPNGASQIIAHSLIEKKYSGCAIRENWMPVGKELTGGGGSLSIYDVRLKQWRQTWMDSSGARVQLDGSLAGSVITISGVWANFAGPGQDALVRMMYQKQADGQGRQWAFFSPGGGKAGNPGFHFLSRGVRFFPGLK